MGPSGVGPSVRLRGFELWRLAIPLRGGFGHAASHRTTTELVLVAAHDEDGRVGWGEALPRAYVTGEDLDTLFDRDAPAMAAAWLEGPALGDAQHTIAALRDALPAAGRRLSCFGAFELALLDLATQTAGVGLEQVLGGFTGPALPAGIVIGFEVSTAKLERHCAALRFGKRRHIKVKVGADDDETRMAIVARVFGDLPIRIDANAAWDADEAMMRLEALARFPIASIEQPVAADDLATMRRIREELGMKVMADESVCSLDDARRVVEAGAADIVNIRLGKMGGMLGAAAIAEFARGAGVAGSLGTMVGETGVLSRASEIFGRCVPGFDYLDGKGQNAFLLAEDVLEPGDDPPSVSRDRVRKYAIGDPTRIGRV
jgi:L-alanine-DL-glutamate epimerase-like enolase superfamily enzyme